LKAALLKRYRLSADGFKRRFRSAKPEPEKTPIQFLIRIDIYLQRWIELAKAEKTFDGLKTLMVQEQYFRVCPKEMAMHLKEGKPKFIQELGEKAENYAKAHATYVVFGIDPKLSNIRSLRSGMRQCSNCHGFGHLQHQCPTSSLLLELRKNSNVATPQQSQPRQHGHPSQQFRLPRPTQQPETGLRCGHVSGKGGATQRAAGRAEGIICTM